MYIEKKYVNTPEDRPEDRYHDFEKAIRDRFERLVAKETPLFKTNVSKDDLWKAYMSGFVDEQAKSHYECNACRLFIARYGSLAIVNEEATIVSAIWNEDEVPEFFKPSVKALRLLVEGSNIKTQFIADPIEETVLGIPQTDDWSHLYVALRRDYKYFNRDRLKNPKQVMAAKREEFGMLSRALNEYSLDTINKTIEFIKSESLYRGDKCIERAEWLKEIKLAMEAYRNQNQLKNIIWLAVAIAPTGFCAVKSSMIGTLLDDIQEGLLSYDSIKRRYDEKMDPANYMRSQNDPTANQIYEAEKTVAKLGIADSLVRRYATIEEIPDKAYVWKPQALTAKKKENKSSGTSIFGHLKAKDTAVNITDASNLPTTTMTWDKFQKTVLTSAKEIYVLTDNPNRNMSILTASYPESENILQWNNPFSWSYKGGVDAEMRRRLEQFGAQYENNEIRCSLMWEGSTDLDLHCIDPNSYHIYYSSKRTSTGYLDLDMNGLDKRSEKPVENIRWQSNAPEGKYRFYVHNFSERVHPNRIGTPFKVELEVNGQVYSYEGASLPHDESITVFEFYYEQGQIRFVNDISQFTSSNSNSNKFVKVAGIIKSPNLWEEQQVIGAGDHTFFLLEDVKPEQENNRGFFNEMLKSDLKSIRKVLEAYTAQTPIEGIENASACGVGYSKDQPWNLTVKVVTDTSTRLIKIDRFD